MSTFFERKNCRLCESTHIQEAFSLRPSPPANQFVDSPNVVQEKFPLKLNFCLSCFHLQLAHVVDPRLLFSNYVYVSGTSPAFVKHFEDYYQNVIETCGLKNPSFVLEIGSNDGTMLKFFKKAGHQILGVDPAQEISKTANDQGIET